MRVLWFANTPSNYAAGGSAYNGQGWVSALETAISGKVQLGVAFLTRTSPREMTLRQVNVCSRKVKWGKDFRHEVTYYPVFNGYDRSRGGRFSLLIHGDARQEADLVAAYRRIVADFRPDVIQIFGSEHSFGLVAAHTDVPVILHVQGLIGPCFRAYLPPGASWRRFILTPPRLGQILQKIYTREKLKRAAAREQRILAGIRYYLGRTEWDHAEVRKIRPDAVFFEGGELLRRPFYEADIEAVGSLPSRLSLVTIISEAPYKGFDLVLRTGRLLREEYRLDFEWNVFGNVEPRFFEELTGISVEDAGITLAGVADASELVDALGHASLYVHPSYIDNSPNAVCEAQLLGAAVVATSVGGVPSLIEDGRTGFLVRSGSPDEIAERVVAMYRNKDLLRSVGRQAREVALRRHDRDRIAAELLAVWQQLV